MCVESCPAFYADSLNAGLYVCVGKCGSEKCEGFEEVEEGECPEGCPEPYIIWEHVEIAGAPALNCSSVCTSADAPFIDNNTCVSACPSYSYQLRTGPPEQLICTENCPGVFIKNETGETVHKRCVDTCLTGVPYLEEDGACVAFCASNLYVEAEEPGQSEATSHVHSLFSEVQQIAPFKCVSECPKTKPVL